MKVCDITADIQIVTRRIRNTGIDATGQLMKGRCMEKSGRRRRRNDMYVDMMIVIVECPMSMEVLFRRWKTSLSQSTGEQYVSDLVAGLVAS